MIRVLSVLGIFFSHMALLKAGLPCPQNQLTFLGELNGDTFYYYEGLKCCGDLTLLRALNMEMLKVFTEAMERRLPRNCLWLPLKETDGVWRWFSGKVADASRFKPEDFWTSLQKWAANNVIGAFQCAFTCPFKWEWEKGVCMFEFPQADNKGFICKRRKLPIKKKIDTLVPSRVERRKENRAFKNVKSDVYITGRATVTSRTLTAIQCVRLCSNSNDCSMVNYNTIDKQCRMFQTIGKLSVTQPKKGWAVWKEI